MPGYQSVFLQSGKRFPDAAGREGQYGRQKRTLQALVQKQGMQHDPFIASGSRRKVRQGEPGPRDDPHCRLQCGGLLVLVTLSHWCFGLGPESCAPYGPGNAEDTPAVGRQKLQKIAGFIGYAFGGLQWEDRESVVGLTEQDRPIAGGVGQPSEVLCQV